MDIKKLLERTNKLRADIQAKTDYEIQNTVESNNSKIAIFNRIPNENFYYPYNKTAVNYCIEAVSSNISRLEENINYRILGREEKQEMMNQYNLLINLFRDIEIKKSGRIEITPDIMIFEYEYGNLTPLNKNSSVNFSNIYQLISNTPKTNEILWRKLNIDI
ncbi:hypothetical protein SDC9_53933 [bioreactor metagenome]|uniref:Uncharacterized protein n=1 Tax=bioreactor metagenome TaxID=1076179 RepID=A0A644VRA8_9ZZZZ|nr:hypothetical protein [Methanobrevibacter sp.]MEA4957156.1 hypothetical protein [Methanobrevibacter sp.]